MNRAFPALLCLLLAACGSDDRSQLGLVQHDEELFPVSGKVLVDGEPAKNAVVVFHRKENLGNSAGRLPQGPRQPNPRGECDEEGDFELYTYLSIDGAPAGSYLVTVSWRDPEGEGREGENYPELLPRRFQVPMSSGLKVEIPEEETALPPFELTR